MNLRTHLSRSNGYRPVYLLNLSKVSPATAAFAAAGGAMNLFMERCRLIKCSNADHPSIIYQDFLDILLCDAGNGENYLPQI